MNKLQVLTIVAAVGWCVVEPQAQTAVRYRGRVVPLCPGLTIVTAIEQPTGDYESIKRIDSATPDGVRVRYSSYMQDPKLDYETNGSGAPPPALIPYSVYRNVLAADLENATAYQQQFAVGIPETIRNTTALGISSAIFRSLKAGRKVPMTLYSPLVPGSIDGNGEPTFSLIDFRMFGEIERDDRTPSTLTLLVNDRPASLPVLRATGSIDNRDAEFFFLDDSENPLALKWAVGTDSLQVIKISHACGGLAAIDGVNTSAADALEKALADKGRVDVYSIFFAFNSDVIREESETTLRDVAAILGRHPDWRVTIEGHTDGIGGEAANAELSRRRAAAVKEALTQRHHIAPNRLAASGYGKARPRDTNETLEGRARNRRVELVRSSP